MVAFYSKVYLVGEHNEAPDSPFPPYINPKFILLEQHGNRISLQVFYLDSNVKPIGNIRLVVPEGPGSPSAVMDAVIAFYPEWFAECKTLPEVLYQLKNREFLDLDLEMPSGWKKLREEAYLYYFKLRIDVAEFKESVM